MTNMSIVKQYANKQTFTINGKDVNKQNKYLQWYA